MFEISNHGRYIKGFASSLLVMTSLDFINLPFPGLIAGYDRLNDAGKQTTCFYRLNALLAHVINFKRGVFS